MKLDELIGALRSEGDVMVGLVSANWTQGRTLYGGATAALALAGTRALLPGLPPLRSAQVAFVGPIAEQVKIRPRLLRQGRSASFVATEVSGIDPAIGAQINFVFAESRESVVERPAQATAPESIGEVLNVPAHVLFATNFDHWFAGDGHSLVDRWVRLKEDSALDAEIELMVVADLLPPPALFEFPSFVPLSSMSWQIDLYRPAVRSADRRWRLTSIAEMVRGGLSAQSMKLGDGDGKPAAAGRQLVSLFG